MSTIEESSSLFTIACLGDVVGRAGRAALRRRLIELRAEHQIDLVITNGENCAGGLGIDNESVKELLGAGVDIITSGDHSWNKKEAIALFERVPQLIRPFNYPPGTPGKGWTVVTLSSGVRVGVMNLLGRVFMGAGAECPFRAADQLLQGPLADAHFIICDFHAEATSEKIAMGRYLDGRVHLLVGTHTHVQTADEGILPKGTGYITDLGMCGPLESVIGMDIEVAIHRFLSPIPRSYKVARGDASIHGILVKSSLDDYRLLEVKRVKEMVRV